MQTIVYINDLLTRLIIIIIIKHNKTSCLALLVIIYKKWFLNVLDSVNYASRGFANAAGFSVVCSKYSGCHVK